LTIESVIRGFSPYDTIEKYYSHPIPFWSYPTPDYCWAIDVSLFLGGDEQEYQSWNKGEPIACE
jgi:hypothetical protein